MTKYEKYYIFLAGWIMLNKLSYRAQIIVVAVFGVLLFFCGVKYHQMRLDDIRVETTVKVQGDITEGEEKESGIQREEKPETVTVHVAGEVVNPGVYTLEKGSRVNDAVELAEPTEKADLSLLNLAMLLVDGKQIYVACKGEREKRDGGYAQVSTESGIININTAGSSELQELPGIGPALAQRIIDYRKSNGDFRSVDDLLNVKGIGSATLEEILDRIAAE